MELHSDHPGFTDQEYRKRRGEIARIAYGHNFLENNVKRVDYTKQEVDTWNIIYNILRPLHKINACQEYNEVFNEMHKYCGFKLDNIPQIQDINDYLIEKTGFQLIPIPGQLSSRDFLNYLAFRRFPCTQYIRHYSLPYYTPEPDNVHEFIGHAPLFANSDFADFSQQIGLASLGATDSEIKKLAACYWFTIEFGVILEKDGVKKGYGAAVLSSVDELRNAISEAPEFKFFDPFEACDANYPLTTLQPMYWWSRSFEEAKQLISKYLESVPKKFITAFDKERQEIKLYQNIAVSK